MLKKLQDGKYEVTWPVATVKLLNGHTLQGRPETLEMLTGMDVKASGEVRRVSANRAELEKQL